MNCSQCGKTGFVNISGKRFCSTCGAKLDETASPSATPVTPTMADIKTHGKPLDLRASATAKAAASASSATTSTTTPMPAGQLHGRQVSGSAVLDLRAKPPLAAPPDPALALTATTLPPPPNSKEALESAPKAALIPPTPIPVKPPPTEPTSAAAPTPPPAPPQPQPIAVAPANPPSLPTAPAATPILAPAVTRVATAIAAAPPATSPAAPATPTPPVTPAATPAPSAPAAIFNNPLINKFDPHPAIGPTPGTSDLPGVVATHVDAMSKQAATAPPPPAPPQSPALQQALAAAKKSTNTSSVLKVAAAVTVIGLMAGGIWIQNSPKLAFHDAAAKAGIDASLPTYLPSSYHQSGPVSASPGQLVMAFTSPVSSAIKIVQEQTSWDANSLRDNYISRQTDNYLTVQGQGLTIYLYGDQANWVNHGVWYQINGISGLSRDQVLKIAYGL
jgi:hypothetical protein